MNSAGFFIISLETPDLVSRLTTADIHDIFDKNSMSVERSFTMMSFERMSVEEARSLRSKIGTNIYSGTVIVLVDRLPFDAQQSLLKILEELPQGIQLYLVISHEVQLLPTVLSRCLFHYRISYKEESQEQITAQSLEKLHKKDPELHKRTVSILGNSVLQKILTASHIPMKTRSDMYNQALQLLETIQTARSAKMIGDYFLNVQAVIGK